MNIRKYLSAFKWLNGLGAAVGITIPAYSYFTALDPPLLPAAGVITSALGAATIFVAFYYRPKKPRGTSKLPTLVKLGRNYILASLFILIAYLILTQLCTVLEPQKQKVRFQIGFGRADWTLTEEGRRVKAALPGEPVTRWMLSKGAFKRGGPETIWKPWSIYLAGGLMVASFFLMFGFWTFGWSLMAKHKANDTQNPSNRRTSRAQMPGTNVESADVTA